MEQDTYEVARQKKKEALEEVYGEGNVFLTDELLVEYEIEDFLMPDCYGRNRATGEKVVISFIGSPRVYYNPRPR